jgi:hypothetical protein
MNINDAFPGTYFKAADVAQPRTLTIATVSIEQMQDGTQKPAISFNESQQKFVLNKTNANTLSASLGPQTENWTGRQIELYQDQASFQGRVMPCVRCRLPQGAAQTSPPQQPIAPQQPVNQDEVPF